MSVKFAVYITPVIPFAAPPVDKASPDAGLWSPTSCTLIYTSESALLVDCPVTIAATAGLVDWIKTTLPSGSQLKYFITTHAHGDHFFGFPVLQEAFPTVQAYATANVIGGVEEQYAPDFYDTVWKPSFPTTPEGTGLPEERATFTALSAGTLSPVENELILDGHIVRVHDVPHGDTQAASFIHVPDLRLVVAGDLVYNGHCHQYLAEANDPHKREQWVDALTQIAAVNPAIIIPGHAFDFPTEPDQDKAKAMLDGTEAYIHDFAKELGKANTKDELLARLRDKYGKRWNLWILGQSVDGSWTNK